MWGRCLAGEVGRGGRTPGPAGTAGGWSWLVGQRSGTGMLYRRPSAPRRRPATSARCTSTDRSPSAAREDGSHTRETPEEEGGCERMKICYTHLITIGWLVDFWPVAWVQRQSCKERLSLWHNRMKKHPPRPRINCNTDMEIWAATT